MKVQSFKSIMLLSICGWGVTGALAFWAGNKFGTNGDIVASATKNSKGTDKDALQRALEKAVMAHSTSTKDPGAPTADQLLALKGKADPALIARWAASLSPGDCAKEMADLQKMPAGTKRDAMLSALYESWAQQDPQGFLASAGKMTSPLARQASTAKALTAWATQDPKSALAWLDKNPATTGALQTQQYNAIIAGFAANNPTDAYNFVMALPDGVGANSPQAQQKIDAMRAVISGMADKGNFTDIVALVGQMPASSQIQRQAYSELVSQWVSSSPTDAAQWITGLDPTQFPQARQYSSQLVQTWALSDPLAAASWAAQQDAARLAANTNGAQGARGGGGRGGNLLSTAVGQMIAVGDVDQAGTYINTLQAGPVKDSAIATFATGAVSTDPATAMIWADSINDPILKNRTLNSVAVPFSQEDPEGFSKYLGGLDPTTAAQLQQRVQQAAAQQAAFAAQNGGVGFAQGANGGGRGGRNAGAGNGAVGFQPAGGNNAGNQVVGGTAQTGGPNIITGNGQGGRGRGTGGGRGGRGGGG